MSIVLDETAADVPVRDSTVPLSIPLPSSQAVFAVHHNARSQPDASKIPREELEDRFLCLHEENLHLKHHVNGQNDKIKKLGTKLLKMVNDRKRLEKLIVDRNNPTFRVRDLKMEEMVEELQEKVRMLQKENEILKQNLRMARQQLMSLQPRRPSQYRHVQSRVNSGLKKLQDDASSCSMAQPKVTRSLEEGRRHQTGLMPRFGHSLLEEARAEIRNLENVIEMQRSQMEHMIELQKDEMKKKETEYEEKLLQLRQQETCSMRSHVDNNVTVIRLRKQLDDTSKAATELQRQVVQQMESGKSLKVSYDAVLMKVDELLAQLEDEKKKNLDLEDRLNVGHIRVQQLQEQLLRVEQDRDTLKESSAKVLNSPFNVSQEQKWQIQEQQLKLQISQLETALQADLAVKNEILYKIKTEEEINEKLTEENKKLQMNCLEKQQQLEELDNRLKLYSRASEYDAAELTEALLLIKKSQKEAEFPTGLEKESSNIRELQAAHAETIQELQKTRNILNIESKICNDYKLQLELQSKKMESNLVMYEKELERQAQLSDVRAEKINSLEVQLRDIRYGTRTHAFKAEDTGESEADEFNETLHLGHGENLVELQIIGATLSPSALELLGNCEPSTFCTYKFYAFEMHCTPVVAGHKPKYGFTSKYMVNMDDNFVDYIHKCSVTVELHQRLGSVDWRTVATAQLRLQELLELDGKVHGSIPLVGTSEELRAFGSLDYWLRLRVPITKTIPPYKEKMKAVDYIHSALPQDTQRTSSSWNELDIKVQSCRDLKSRGSHQPSPYVVYKFCEFPDYPTATIHNCCHPHFNDIKSYSVPMDVELDLYLKSELLQFYVFDSKEEEMDVYMGKAKVALLPLAQDQEINGLFKLTDPSGLPAGHIELTLKWKYTYVPSSDGIKTSKEPLVILNERAGQLMQELPGWQDEEEVEVQEEEEKASKDHPHASSSLTRDAVSQVPLPQVREKRLMRQAKKVTFVDPTTTDDTQQVEDRSSAGLSISAENPQMMASCVEDVLSPAAQSVDKENSEDSQVSKGELVPTNYESDDSDISEDIAKDVDEALSVEEDQGELNQSDSDDCIVQGQTSRRKPSERLRVEILSLTLRPECWLAQDSNVARLFVEYSLLDLPTEETPLSLPKPTQGKSINYNYSNVVPLDSEKNDVRRRLLRAVLQGQNPEMEKIRFTVVSEPPEEEEQQECEDVGAAFLRIPDILEQQQDLIETSLNIVDADDSSMVLGSLTVTVEGLEALQSIMEDQDQQFDPITSLFPLR